MARLLLAKTKNLVILLLILAVAVTMFRFFPRVKAETKIIIMAPSSGYVGDLVNVWGNISTENGQYKVHFDDVEIASGNALGYDVKTEFNVTATFSGDHNVTLIDVATEEDDTSIFTVLTSYSLTMDVPESPKQPQEGDYVPISLNVTGGESTKTFVANITVQAPTNISYASFFNITTSTVGIASETIVFPDNFTLGANTNFAGEYSVFLNETLAGGVFAVGLTNSTEFHRSQYVDVKATGYNPDENVTIAIIFEEDLIHAKNLTAFAGIVRYSNWTIPSNASIGTYTVNVTSISSNATIKEPPDTQDFAVPGFDVNITTRNLAGEHVPDVNVQAFEEGELVDEETSGAKGLVVLKLEKGEYRCDAYYQNETVGVFTANVTQELSLDFYCNLTNLRIFIKDKTGLSIPEAKISLKRENETLFENTTGIEGVTVAHSLLPSGVYIVNASRYGIHFNTTTITQLPTTSWYELTVICPTLKLEVNVSDSENQPIQNAAVKARELMGGLNYEANTVNGLATLNCTLGKYEVEVYVKGIEVNETAVDLFVNQKLLVNCRYCGLSVQFKVVDYFGQPISNARLVLKREGLLPLSNETAQSGVAVFNNIIGGPVQTTIYLNNQAQPSEVKTFLVDQSETFEIKIKKYVLLAGFLVETSYLVTAIIITVTVALILSIEVYRKKTLRSPKSSS